MILLADIIDAQEALRIGLVNRVVPAEQLEQETLKLAERLARGPTVAYGLAKTGLYRGLGMPLEDVLNMEARNQAIAARTPDRAEGVAAFREKRPPRFTGRAGVQSWAVRVTRGVGPATDATVLLGHRLAIWGETRHAAAQRPASSRARPTALPFAGRSSSAASRSRSRVASAR